VNSWSITCVGTDDTLVAATITASLSIDSVNKIASFTAPGLGTGLRFQSQINGGVNINGQVDPTLTTTFGIYVLTGAGRRVITTNETIESSLIYGWVTSFNAMIRAAPAPGGSTNQIQTNGGAGTLAGIPITYSGGVLTDTIDSKSTPIVAETHLATASGTLATLSTFALAGLTGAWNLRAAVSVTDSTGANVGWWTINAGYKVASGTPTNIFGSTATNDGKAGTIAGTEVTLAISTSNVLVQVTPPSAAALTWTIYPFARMNIA
jgi:hypothetical protein